MVGPLDWPDWSVTPDEFRDALRRQWPDAEVHALPNSRAELTVVLDPDADLSTTVRLYKGCMVSVDGPLERIVQVAVWFRSLAPDDADVWLFHPEGMEDAVRVEPGMDPEELLRLCD